MMGTKGMMRDPNRFHLLGDWAVTNVRRKWGSTESFGSNGGESNKGQEWGVRAGAGSRLV